MEITNVTIGKRDRDIPIARVKYGDKATSAVRFIVDRYAGGVDLSGLGWSVKIVSGTNEDVVTFTPEVKDNTIEYTFTLPAIVASTVGRTEIELEAVNSDSNKVWQSGIRYIEVLDDLDAEPNYTPESASILQQTIYSATEKLNSMSSTADTKITQINTAVSSANSAKSSAETALTNANTALSTVNAMSLYLNTKINEANTAISGANTAAASATSAASGANTIKETLEAKLAAGEFKGAKGDKGDKGDTGAAGSDASVTSENIASALGYTPADDSELSAAKAALSELEPITGTTLPTASASNHTRFAIVTGATDKLYINLRKNGSYMWFQFVESGTPVEDAAILGSGLIGTLVLGRSGN